MLGPMATTFEIPELRTDRLTLRAFRAADLDAFAAMEADPEVRRYRGNDLRTRPEVWATMQFALGQWALRGYGLFAIELTSDTAFIGFAGILHPAEWPEPELAYSLAQSAWGRGFATEAATAARAWAFAHHGFSRLASFILAGNTRSVHVAEKLGATRDGTVIIRGFEAERWVHQR